MRATATIGLLQVIGLLFLSAIDENIAVSDIGILAYTASASHTVSVMRTERGARCAVHTPLQELMLTSLTMSMEVC